VVRSFESPQSGCEFQFLSKCQAENNKTFNEVLVGKNNYLLVGHCFVQQLKENFHGEHKWN
jgi:hypothetical protein